MARQKETRLLDFAIKKVRQADNSVAGLYGGCFVG